LALLDLLEDLYKRFSARHTDVRKFLVDKFGMRQRMEEANKHFNKE
jgi:hypothetical protein